MNVLIACEFSGIVRESFKAKGHNAWSCDLLPTEISGNHYQEDFLISLGRKEWDLIIAHPPCTYLCNSGVRWLKGNPDRYERMIKAAEFFNRIFTFRFNPDIKICVENPIPHKYALAGIGRKYDQLIQPYQFGHGETKATCLWLYNLPKLLPTNIVEGREGKVWRMAPGPNRAKDRSRTYEGIALAMANQWG